MPQFTHDQIKAHPADVVFVNVYHDSPQLIVGGLGGQMPDGLVLQQSDNDQLAGNVLPYDIKGVTPELREAARAREVEQNPAAAALWDGTPHVTISVVGGHYRADGSSRRRR